MLGIRTQILNRTSNNFSWIFQSNIKIEHHGYSTFKHSVLDSLLINKNVSLVPKNITDTYQQFRSMVTKKEKQTMKEQEKAREERERMKKMEKKASKKSKRELDKEKRRKKT